MQDKTRKLDGVMDGETVLNDNYPVYGDYLYVADEKVVRSDVFGTVRDGLFRRLFPFHSGLRDLSDTLQQAWADFARQGAPQHHSLPAWPRYDPERRATMLLGPACSVQEGVFEERRRLWVEFAAA